jgi:hypothetical protein
MQKLLKSLFTVCVLFLFKPISAQDIRAAWMEYKWLTGYTYSLSATLVVDSATAQSHTLLSNYFGDGDSCSNSSTGPSGGKFITYKANCTHTYSGPGSFKPYLIENYRVNGIKNITNSATKNMWIESLLKINQFGGPNSSPLFTLPPMAITEGSLYTYNPGLFDPEGTDSLSYHLLNCAVTPTNATYIPANSGINSAGTFTFQADTVGLYAFKIHVKEWRKGNDNVFQLVGTNEMDFTIEVKASVGINELGDQKSISFFPNPTSDFLNITTTKLAKEIEILNALGQTIQKRTFSKTIDVSNLEPGCYFIRIDNSYSKFIRN